VALPSGTGALILGRHPQLLQAGLGPALRELASRSSVPVEVSSTGLTGLSDRVAARGGRFLVESTSGSGTTLRAELACVS
jgi:signal transduction histidine kinase